MKDFYQILGVAHNASSSEIAKAYKKLALKWHPDKNADNVGQATEKFKEIADAYQILNDSQEREKYDLELSKNKDETFDQQHRLTEFYYEPLIHVYGCQPTHF